MFSLPFQLLLSVNLRSLFCFDLTLCWGRHWLRHDKFLRPWHHNVFFRGLSSPTSFRFHIFRLLFSVILSMKCIVLHSSRLPPRLSLAFSRGLSCYLRNLSSELFVPIYYFCPRVQATHESAVKSPKKSNFQSFSSALPRNSFFISFIFWQKSRR